MTDRSQQTPLVRLIKNGRGIVRRIATRRATVAGNFFTWKTKGEAPNKL